MPMKYDFLIVGAGFAGAVCAERLAAAGKTVLVVEKRDHTGGNAHDRLDAHGVLIHPYGPHIFHTNSERIFGYLSRFTDWRPYEHRVLAYVEGKFYPLPINRTTINALYGLSLSVEETAEHLAHVREPREMIRNSEDVVLDRMGRDLCEKFFRGYTRKQWGLDLSELAPGVAARIPIRTGDDDRYFTDAYQFMPAHGFHQLFKRLLQHERIQVLLETDYQAVRSRVEAGHTIYTGPIDEYFEYQFGPLHYRSLRFEHLHRAEVNLHQPVGQVNYPNDYEFTRVTEFKHLTGQQCGGTSIVREYPGDEGEPFYPVPREENEALYQKYRSLAEQQTAVSFLGRLAQYRYFNMDQVVGAALTLVERLLSA
jgi:UDP-galactopyranose mutase